MPEGQTLTGLDRLARGDDEACAAVRGRRVGLLAHPASVDRRLRHAVALVREAGAHLRTIFGPEHGFDGHAQDMIGVASGEGAGGPAVRSLYGDSAADLSPRPEWLEDLDAVVVDLQDVGSRYYTFVWSAAFVLRAAAQRGIETVVLDRPNPLGGEIVEGAPQRPGYRSFVGLYDVAVRHGMTIAEILRWVQREEGLDQAALRVVPMLGWERRLAFEETGLPWVAPSPNMPTPDTARVYPGGCVVEGTTLSEGRGTTRPFEIWGGPGVDGAALARTVEVEGAILRPLSFRPTFQKHAGALCGGVQVHVTDPARFRSYHAYLRMIAAALGHRLDAFPWRTEAYEYVTDRPAIDLLTGGPEYRQAVNGGAALEPLLEEDAAGAARFAEARREVLLYPS